MQAINSQMQAIMDALRKKSQSLSNSEATTPITPKEYFCDKCKDEGGSIITKKAGEKTLYMDYDGTLKETFLKRDTEEWQECECMKMRRLNRLIKSSEITEEFQKMGFGNFDTTGLSPEIENMKQAAFNYYTHFDDIRSTRVNSCLFYGQPGCGKTHLLTAISNNLMRKKLIPVLYFPYLDGMRNMAENEFAKKDYIMQQMRDVPVLFIDDLFKPIGGKPSALHWQVTAIQEVVNHRYLNNLPILVSTELDFNTLVDIDEALASRIFEMASDFTVTVTKNMANNYRFKKLRGA